MSKLSALLLAILLPLLGSSLWLNQLLYQKTLQYYREANQTRLDPLGISQYSDQAPPKTTDQLRVVFLGDSRAADWVVPQQSDHEFIHRGIGSQTTTQVWQRFEAHVVPLQPDVVVVQVGINDLKTIPLFPTGRDAIIADCKVNIRRIVAAARDLEALVIVTTIFPTGTVPLERRPVWSSDIDLAVQTVNADLATLASESVWILDTFPLLADHRGKLNRAYVEDELHINEHGYQALNQALVKLLDQHRNHITSSLTVKQ